MELKLDRKYKLTNYTIGKLSINGVYFCDTLEDIDRKLSSDMDEAVIREKKYPGMTAIPTGSYRIQLGVVSPKFSGRVWATRWGGRLPRILCVKGFEGVLIHVGNTVEDTEGCVLVGWNKVKGQVKESTVAFDSLMLKLIEADYRKEDIILTIV